MDRLAWLHENSAFVGGLRWVVFFFKQKTAYEIGVRLVGSEMCIRDRLYKIGAAATFIKRGAEVECITSQSLPVGAQVQMDISVQETKLTGGDFVVMVTDGVLEYLHVKKPEDTMQEIIESIQTNNPGILAKKIMERVMLFTGGKAKDDMTVLAACIWEK